MIRKLSDLLDPVIAFFVKMVVYLNRYGMYGAQEAMRGSVTALLAASLADNFQKKIMKATAGDKVNDSAVGKAYDVAMGVANAGLNYFMLFDKDSGNLIGGSIPDGGTAGTYQALDGKQRAERMMAELTNASRTGKSSFPIKWETDGGISAKDFVGGVAGEILNGLLGHVKVSGRLTLAMDASAFTEELSLSIDTSLITNANNAAKECESSAGPAQNQKKDCDAKQAVCDKDQAKCNTDQAKCNTDQGKCDSDTAACAATPGSPACSTKAASCSAASSSCNTSTASCNKANTSCNEASKSCKKAEDLANENKSKCDSADNASNELKQSSATQASGKKNFVWMDIKDSSAMTRGRALVSACHVEAGLGIPAISGGGKPKIVGVQAAKNTNDRMHCHYDGRYLVPTGICPDYAWTKAIKCVKDNNHEFWGMTRYVSFNIASNQNYPFGQTDYIGLVNKAPKDARFAVSILGFGDNTLRMGGWNGKGKEATFHARSPGLDTLATGLNGWARAQAYYHRPGAWAEPPNLFNPYWKARLAPLGPQIGRFTNSIPGLGGPIRDIINTAVVH